MVQIRALLVDDHPIFRVGLARVLTAAGIDVVADVGSGSAALSVVKESKPDVILLDVALPDVDGFRVCRDLVEADPTVRVILVTSYDDSASIRAGRAAGARGYLSKETSPTLIVEMIRRVVEEADFEVFPKPDSVHITDRELDVLGLLSRGHTQPEVARELQISLETVKSYVREIYGKLGVHDRAEALAVARRLGLLSSPPGSGVPQRSRLG